MLVHSQPSIVHDICDDLEKIMKKREKITKTKSL